VDKEIESTVVSALEKITPGLSVVGEEEHCNWGEGSVPIDCWILDPLDGTRNFIRGYGRFAVSLGLRLGGDMVLGLIYQPVSQHLFWAVKTHGAWHNDRQVKVAKEKNPSKWTVSLGMPFKAVGCLDGFIEVYRDLFSNGVAIRHTGSAALDMAYTAAGIFDGTVALAMAPWDVAAGIVLIEEAGGSTVFLEDLPFLLSCSVVGGSREFFKWVLGCKATKDIANCLKKI
jgi:myo-inositol-1(or 4)-monophosphatase